VPPLVRRALRARRPVPSKAVLAQRTAEGFIVDVHSFGGAPRCARPEGTGSS
jgi:hypothetical protein